MLATVLDVNLSGDPIAGDGAPAALEPPDRTLDRPRSAARVVVPVTAGIVLAVVAFSVINGAGGGRARRANGDAD